MISGGFLCSLELSEKVDCVNWILFNRRLVFHLASSSLFQKTLYHCHSVTFTWQKSSDSQVPSGISHWLVSQLSRRRQDDLPYAPVVIASDDVHSFDGACSYPHGEYFRYGECPTYPKSSLYFTPSSACYYRPIFRHRTCRSSRLHIVRRKFSFA